MNRRVDSRVRPWTQGPVVRRSRRDKVTIVLPTVDTYRYQMEQVQRLYERLRLTEPRRPQTQRSPASHSLTSLHRIHMTRSHTFAAACDTHHTLTPSPARSYGELLNGQGHTQEPQELPEMPSLELSNGQDSPRQQTVILTENDHHEKSQIPNGAAPSDGSPHPSRPLTFSYPGDQTGNVRQGGRKHGWMNPPSNVKPEAEKRKAHAEDEASSSGVSSEEGAVDKVKDHVELKDPYRSHDPNRDSFRHDQSVDILQLCEHLKTQGLGEPILSMQSHTGRPLNALPPGVKARCLPRDPSTREKIKGRARLDYELANLRAVAFCEQQHPRAFRTASADLKNRDLRLLEEEERENIHRNLVTGRGGPDDQNYVVEDDDDDSSLVGSPLSREELFLRIEAWADDVDKALNRG